MCDDAGRLTSAGNVGLEPAGGFRMRDGAVGGDLFGWRGGLAGDDALVTAAGGSSCLDRLEQRPPFRCLV
jgi:hypothetical protein